MTDLFYTGYSPTEVTTYSPRKIEKEESSSGRGTKPDETKETFSPKISMEEPDEQLTTVPKLERGEDLTDTELNLVTDEVTEAYLSYNTKSLITKIVDELSQWESLGTEESLIHVSNIKDILNSYSAYLSHKPENRIFSNLTGLIFENNRWLTLQKTQIKALRMELDRFSEGYVNWDNLRKFSKQLYRINLSPIKLDEEKEEKE